MIRRNRYITPVKRVDIPVVAPVVSSVVDLSLYQKKETGKGLSTNDYTTAKKSKLAGISETGGYLHPESHPATMITEDATHRFATDTEKSLWNGKGSSNLALGELSTDAYRGDRGKTAYDHSQATHAPATAEQNVNADWNSSSGDSQILNKPTIVVSSNLAYGIGWDENTDVPTKNAIYDKIETMGTGGGLTQSQVRRRIC